MPGTTATRQREKATTVTTTRQAMKMPHKAQVQFGTHNSSPAFLFSGHTGHFKGQHAADILAVHDLGFVRHLDPGQQDGAQSFSHLPLLKLLQRLLFTHLRSSLCRSCRRLTVRTIGAAWISAVAVTAGPVCSVCARAVCSVTVISTSTRIPMQATCNVGGEHALG